VRLSHVLETHSFPHAVPLKRMVLAYARDVRAASLYRARGRGRDPGSLRGLSLLWWSERGVQSSAVRCRVLVPMMPVRLRGDRFLDLCGISIGLHPLWLELGDGLTPLLRYDLKKRSKSKACLRASMK
jgi:hypothetical protein